jgi:hypothetical protein
MAQSYEFLIARADQAAQEAEDAKLDNVRQRALRSEAAWREMADRARKIERDRETAKRERAERQAEEQAQAEFEDEDAAAQHG